MHSNNFRRIFETSKKIEIMKTELSITEQIDLELAKILVLSNLINRKTEMCCFSEDVAHCGYIEIKITESKTNYDKCPATFKVKYEVSEEYDWLKDDQSRLDDCERCVDFLENVLKDRKIDYSVCYAVTEKIITSYEI